MKRWKLRLTILTMLVPAGALATDLGPGEVSGTWDAAGSPYVVQGHITLPAGQGLTIEPGVQVLFNGPYVLTIEGDLTAVGVEGDSILFSRALGKTDWGHIEIISGTADIQYCRIEHGNATQLEPPHSKNGGGLFVGAGPGPIIYNSIVQDCRAEDGGGIFFSSLGQIYQSVVCRCVAEGSSGTGGGIYASYNPVIAYCEIADNVAQFLGGGIYAHYLAMGISYCVIHGNHVQAGHGGGLAFQSLSGTATFNLIYGNSIGPGSYSDGGGAYFWYGAGSFDNNTVVGNEAPAGAGLAYGKASTQFTGNIVAFNEGDATCDLTGSTPSFDFTCSYGNTGSDALVGTDTNTLNMHPLFCDYGAANFMLCADSPCMDPVLIGAKGQGCGNCYPAAEGSSWSRLKSLY